MAIRILYPGVGESDAIQPGSKTSVEWDFSDLLVDEEVVASATIIAVDRANAAVADVAGDAVIVEGAALASAVSVPLNNLIDGEQYKITITATISDDKIAVVTIFVPIVAP